MKKNITIFASGTGTNAQKIIDHFKSSPLASVTLIVSNNPKAGVLKIAEREDIPVLLVNKQKIKDATTLPRALAKSKTDWIILAGFLWKIPEYLIRAYPNHIINIHPALLPKYGGKGMYGHYVHDAVIAAGEKESGITIHYINDHYDEGETILQKKCTISPADDAEKLAQKVQLLEHKWFAPTIEKIIREEIGK